MKTQQHFTPTTLGIMGGSASGKTTFAALLAEQLADCAPVVLNQDAYFRDWAEYSPEEREKVITANHPDAVLWDALVEDIAKLRRREAIAVPAPGTRAAQRSHTPAQNLAHAPTVVQPSDVVIVEGHLIFWSAALRKLMDIKVFLDVDAHERVLRRMLRDVAQRGGDLEWAINWYRRDVLPNFPVYTEPCKQYADLVVPFHHENPVALQMLVAGIRARIEEGRAAARV